MIETNEVMQEVRERCRAGKRTQEGHLVYCEIDDPDAIEWEIPYSFPGGSLSATFDSKREFEYALRLMTYGWEQGYNKCQKDIRQALGVKDKR